MFCQACGSNIVDGSSFCGHCGARQLPVATPTLQGQQAPPQPVQQAQPQQQFYQQQLAGGQPEVPGFYQQQPANVQSVQGNYQQQAITGLPTQQVMYAQMSAGASKINSSAVTIFSIILIVAAGALSLLDFISIPLNENWDLTLPFRALNFFFFAALILLGFVGIAFSKQLKSQSKFAEWCSGSALGDVIAGFSLCIVWTFSMLSYQVIWEYFGSEIGIVYNYNGIVYNYICIVLPFLGLLIASIVYFVAASKARQAVGKSDGISIVSAVLLLSNALLSLIIGLLLMSGIIYTAFNGNINIYITFINFAYAFEGLFLLAYSITRSIFWISNSKKIAQLLNRQ